MARIVITEFMDEQAVERLSIDHDVMYDPSLVDDRQRLLDAVQSVDAVIVRNRTEVTPDLLEAATGIKAVGRLGVGLDNIDLDACAERGVAVLPATGANADAVAEYVIASILVLTRGVFAASTAVAQGEWPRTSLVGREVGRRVLGLVGLGEIARRVSWRASALGMTVIAHDPYLDAGDEAWNDVASVELSELWQRSDAISIHVPLVEATENLVGEQALSEMKPGAVLVNTSRGGVVDERAVVNALRAGLLGGAALDVFAKEPVTAETGATFSDVPNLILTPHIAGVTEESNRRVSSMVADLVTHELGNTP